MQKIVRIRDDSSRTGKKIAVTLLAFLAAMQQFAPGKTMAQIKPRLQVVYPRENLTFYATDSTFVFGNVSPTDAAVYVQGIAAKKYENGTFMVVVPIRTGEFTFTCHAVWRGDSTTVRRSVYIPPYLATGPVDSFGIDSSFVYPRNVLEVQAGDRINFMFKGTPGNRGYLTIGGVVEDLPMAEKEPQAYFDWGEAVFGQGKPPDVPPVAGIYAATYVIRESDPAGEAFIQFKLISRTGELRAMIAPGNVRILNGSVPRIGRLSRDVTIGRTGPGKGYYFFFPQGVKLWLNGRDGPYYRARLSKTEEAWVPVPAVQLLPPGTLPARSVVNLARTRSYPDRAVVRIFLRERLPFRISQLTQPQRLIVTLYGGVSDTDWIRHDFGDPLIGEIAWRQRHSDVYDLIIHLNTKQQWGYRVYFKDNDLYLEIRKPPRAVGKWRKPLHGLLICIDPGHGPDLGAIGPTGIPEKDATLEYALKLREMLEKKGAQVFLTRENKSGINLASRSKLADAINANIFVSLHFNALPDGVDPFLSRGTSTYYYHTQSYPLAKAVQRRLLRRTRLRDFGLYYDNLSVCRNTAMPAILVEPAFIMHPVEEMKIHDPEFREEVCRGIVEGIEDFVKKALRE